MANPDDMNERIEAEAVAWVVKLTSGQTTSGDLARLRVWRSQSPTHEAAFTFARRTWRDLEALRGELPLLPTEAPSRGTSSFQATPLLRSTARRSSLSAWTMAAAVLIAVGLVVYAASPIAWLRADYHTKTGEVQQLALPDGTTAYLNTHSAITLHFGERERRVEVLYGEAAFTVAKEKNRPFIVETLNVQARALGTEYTVRTDREQVDITVLQRRVAISSRNGASEVVLHGGQTIRCDASSSCGPVTTVDVNSTTAWQRGKLIFDRVPLSTVVAELQRYRRGFIVIADDELAQRTVSGVFRLDELDAAVNTIIAELDLKAARVSSLFTLLY